MGKCVPVLQILSDPESARVLLYIYTLNNHEFVGVDTVAKETGVAKEKVEKTLETIGSQIGDRSHPLHTVSIVKGSGKEEKAYGINMSIGGLLIGVIALLDSYTNASQNYALQINDRSESWIKKMPKK